MDQAIRSMRSRRSVVPSLRALELDRRDGDAVACVQNLIVRHGLPIDANQIIPRLAALQPLLEELSGVHPGLDFDMVGEAAAEVVDQKDRHSCLLWVGKVLGTSANSADSVNGRTRTASRSR